MSDLSDLKISINRIDASGGPIFEIKSDIDLGFSIAISEERTSREHHHEHTTEVYLVLRGWIEIEMNGIDVGVYKEGKSCSILPQVRHRIINASSNSMFQVVCFPAYNPEDVYYD